MGADNGVARLVYAVAAGALLVSVRNVRCRLFDKVCAF